MKVFIYDSLLGIEAQSKRDEIGTEDKISSTKTHETARKRRGASCVLLRVVSCVFVDHRLLYLNLDAFGLAPRAPSSLLQYRDLRGVIEVMLQNAVQRDVMCDAAARRSVLLAA